MKKIAWPALFTLCAVHALLIVLPAGKVGIYFVVFRPTVIFLLVLIFVILSPGYLKMTSSKLLPMAVCIFGAVFFISAIFLLGIIFGFGHNMMSGAINIMIKNIWCFIIPAAFREYLRGQITLGMGNKPSVIVLVSTVFTFCFIDDIKLLLSLQLSPMINFFLDTIIPMTLLNFFFTYLTSTEGSSGNIWYILIYQTSIFLSPFLPSAPKMLIGMTMCLSVFVMYIFYDRVRLSGTDKFVKHHWRRIVLTGILGVLLIMFTSGVFSYFPVVVISNSMKEEFSRGDIVIVHRVDSESAQKKISVGDIVDYQSENGINIVHRVIRIVETESGRKYITKGDNNDVADEKAVSPEQIIGIVRWSAPYAGYLSLFLTMR